MIAPVSGVASLGMLAALFADRPFRPFHTLRPVPSSAPVAVVRRFVNGKWETLRSWNAHPAPPVTDYPA